MLWEAYLIVTVVIYENGYPEKSGLHLDSCCFCVRKCWQCRGPSGENNIGFGVVNPQARRILRTYIALNSE